MWGNPQQDLSQQGSQISIPGFNLGDLGVLELLNILFSVNDLFLKKSFTDDFEIIFY